MRVYIIGSLRNPQIPHIANALEAAGHECFADWWAGGRDADDWWMQYEQARGRTHRQALGGYNAKHIFEYDKHDLDRSHAGVLVMPAGKSGHMELGYLAGQGKRAYILFTREPERWDVMHLFATPVWSVEELVDQMKDTWAETLPRPRQPITPWGSDL